MRLVFRAQRIEERPFRREQRAGRTGRMAQRLARCERERAVVAEDELPGGERRRRGRQARISFLIDGQPFLSEEIVNVGGAFERPDAREALVFLDRSRREPGGSEPHRVVAQIGRHAGAALGRGDEGPHTMRSMHLGCRPRGKRGTHIPCPLDSSAMYGSPLSRGRPSS